MIHPWDFLLLLTSPSVWQLSMHVRNVLDQGEDIAQEGGPLDFFTGDPPPECATLVKRNYEENRGIIIIKIYPQKPLTAP